MITLLRRRATLRGPLGGSRQWTIVWVVLVAARLLRRFTRPAPEVVFCEEIRPGQSLLVSGDDREPRVIGSGSARRR